TSYCPSVKNHSRALTPMLANDSRAARARLTVSFALRAPWSVQFPNSTYFGISFSFAGREGPVVKIGSGHATTLAFPITCRTLRRRPARSTAACLSWPPERTNGAVRLAPHGSSHLSRTCTTPGVVRTKADGWPDGD